MKNTYKNPFLITILLLVSLIYLIFLYIDLAGTTNYIELSNLLKYSGILLCFFTSLFIGKDGHTKRDTLLLQLGLFFTSLADLCLLILNYYSLGVGLFCVVQTIYIYRYNPYRSFRNTLFSLMAVFFLLSLGTFLKPRFLFHIDSLYLLAPLYGILLILSVQSALLSFHRKIFQTNVCYLISIGMVMFLLCDINVALFNIFSTHDVLIINAVSLKALTGFLMWFFYLPSQIMLALSGYSWN